MERIMAMTQSEMTEQLSQAIMLIDDVRNALENEHNSQQCRCVRDKFDSSPTAALNVLQDLLGIQHTTTKEQVIEQLKNIL